MAGIIKNQILKHLSRFVKDLSSDRINVSTLKGEGELTDLKLDEDVLTELLALPIWMKIKKAHCNRARLMIQWTKLKSIPIRLILDTVEIQVEACEELRPVVTTSGGHVNLPSAGKYGFANKVVDGITVTVESVDIKFFSKAFESKVQISRIRVESRSPQWKKVDLTHTRLKDMDRGEVLTFKEIEWQTLRLEAQSTKERHLAPLRLLTNQAKARVVIKKKLLDCTVVGCRLSLILDDLLWVLTDSQILAAVHFMSSLSGLVKQATETSQNVKSARKLETLPEYRAQQTQAASAERLKQSDSARIFDAFDVKETSYHLMCEKIDLHFCDDPGGGRSTHPDLRDGGAGQVQLMQFMIDFYPYHLAKADRRHWPRYSGNDLSHWLKEALASFRGQMMEVLFPKSTGGSNNSSVQSTGHGVLDYKNESIVSSTLSEQLSKLMSTCLILKIRDVCLYKVTTSSREVPLPFLSSYLERPKDISAVHMEFTWFYYPGGVCFPLPSPKLYTQIHPLQVHLDVCTVLWLNSFISNLQNCLPPSGVTKEPDYMDVRVEIVMPKVVFEEKNSYPAQKERPHSLQLQAARVVISNFRSHDTGTTAQLLQALSAIETKTDNNLSAHIPEIPKKFTLHSKGLDKIRERQLIGSHYHHEPHLTTDMLWTEPRDVWFISIDAVWADFCLEQKSKSENGHDMKKKFRSTNTNSHSEPLVMIPFVDSLPVQLWFYSEEEPFKEGFSVRKRKDIQAILSVDRICNIQFTHPQYLFLMRTAESISEISIFLTIDTRKTFNLPGRDDSLTIVGSLPRLEVSFILPFLSVHSEIPRDDSSILEDLDMTLPDPISVERSHKLLEQTNKWNTQDSKPSSFDAFATDSRDPFFQQSPPNSSSLPSMESIKSSLTHGMKQGISSLVVSFSKGGGQSTPDSEVTSMWSTDSSENNFVQLDSPENDVENAFREQGADPNVEVAEEVVEDNSQSTGSIHNPYGREDNEDISVLTVCLNGIELKQNSEGLNSKIALNCRSLAIEELVKVPWNEFQSTFAGRSKKWRTEMEQKNDANKTDYNISNSAIKLQFTQNIDDETFMECLNSDEMMFVLSQAKNTKTPRVNILDRPGPDSPVRKAITKSTHPNLKAEIDLRADQLESQGDNEFITLHASTLKGVSDFFEDEIPPTVLPLQAFVLGLNMELIEEKAPGMPTTKVSLPDGVMVKRDGKGVFSIGCPSEVIAGGRTMDELHNGKNRKKELDESLGMLDLRRTVLELEQQVSELKKEKLYLLSQLQQDNKKQKHIVTES